MLPLWETCHVYSFACFTLVVAIPDDMCLEAPLRQTVYNLQQCPSPVAALAYQVQRKTILAATTFPGEFELAGERNPFSMHPA